MSIYGFAGFPLRDALPRGYGFVDFMRSPPPDGSSGSSGTVSTVRTPGGFAKDARGTITSEVKTKLPDGTVQTNAERSFSDGSERTETWYKRPDGTFELYGERRSMPDDSGMQRVRIWRPVIAPDGTQSSTFREFRVPAGMKLDWDSPQAQQYLKVSMSGTEAADGTILSRTIDPLPPLALTRAVADSSEEAGKDTTTASARDIAEPAQKRETFTF